MNCFNPVQCLAFMSNDNNPFSVGEIKEEYYWNMFQHETKFVKAGLSGGGVTCCGIIDSNDPYDVTRYKESAFYVESDIEFARYIEPAFKNHYNEHLNGLSKDDECFDTIYHYSLSIYRRLDMEYILEDLEMETLRLEETGEDIENIILIDDFIEYARKALASNTEAHYFFFMGP